METQETTTLFHLTMTKKNSGKQKKVQSDASNHKGNQNPSKIKIKFHQTRRCHCAALAEHAKKCRGKKAKMQSKRVRGIWQDTLELDVPLTT